MMGGAPRQEGCLKHMCKEWKQMHCQTYYETSKYWRQKKKIFQRENILDKGIRLRMPLNRSIAIRQQWSKAFKILKENYFQSTLLYPARL